MVEEKSREKLASSTISGLHSIGLANMFLIHPIGRHYAHAPVLAGVRFSLAG